jgi:uncharacterized lipoprotein YbaY
MTRTHATCEPGLAARRIHAQRGQAMLFTLLFAGATALMCLVLYNSGMLANTKTQLQNAADAGAYSGAVLLARDHNFSAYTNRAMVANQVSVAQLVSLKSYTQDAAAAHKRITGPVHTAWSNIIPAFKPIWIGARAVPVEALASAYASVAPAVVVTLDKLIRLFERAQEMHHDVTALNVAFTATEVVKKNDPKASVSLMTFQTAYTVHQVTAWKASTKQHSANDTSAVADRFANVVVSEESTDELIRNRGSVLIASWISLPTSIACPPPSIPVLTVYGFAHDGGTILSKNKKRWLALDATQGAGFVGCVTPVGIPFGYPLLQDGVGGSGGALAGRNGGYGDRIGFSGNPAETRSYGGALNGLVAIPANRRYKSGPGSSMDASTGGLQTYYRDMADPATAPANQSAALNGGQVPFTIEVRHGAADIRTSSKVLGSAAATVNAQETLKGDTMRALSSAHAYFYRSNTDSSAFTKTGWARADHKTEIANLFNPYWQAQLVANPTTAFALSIGSP